jgi:hypothetical protein
MFLSCVLVRVQVPSPIGPGACQKNCRCICQHDECEQRSTQQGNRHEQSFEETYAVSQSVQHECSGVGRQATSSVVLRNRVRRRRACLDIIRRSMVLLPVQCPCCDEAIHIVFHGSSFGPCRLPYELDPHTLATIKAEDFNGTLKLGNLGVHFRYDMV